MNLEEAKKVGHVGEDLVQEYYLSKGYKVDKLTIRDQMIRHYDFLISNDTETLKIEVKYDRILDKERKAFFETTVFFRENDFHAQKGWTQKYSTLSKVSIYYVLPSIQKFLVIPAKLLRTINIGNYPLVTKDININCSVSAVIVPYSDLLKLGYLIDYAS